MPLMRPDPTFYPSPAAHLVYRRFGLGLLRHAWINLDWIWAGALMVTGVVVLVS